METKKEYILHPNLCKQCGDPILPKDGVKLADTKKKSFCSYSCSSTFNSRRRYASIEKNRCQCGKVIRKKYKQCIECLQGERQATRPITKGELFKRRSTWQSARTYIRNVSHRNMEESKRDKVCFCCQYSKHVEIAHIKSVSSFSDDTTIHEICSVDNLVYLCPNCHWEYDNQVLTI